MIASWCLAAFCAFVSVRGNARADFPSQPPKKRQVVLLLLPKKLFPTSLFLFLEQFPLSRDPLNGFSEKAPHNHLASFDLTSRIVSACPFFFYEGLCGPPSFFPLALFLSSRSFLERALVVFFSLCSLRPHLPVFFFLLVIPFPQCGQNYLVAAPN